MVGVAGAAIHVALHAPDRFTSLVTDPNVWFGEPPPLVPLSFAAAGCLGLIALSCRSGASSTQPPVAIARILDALAAACGLAATIAATLPGADSFGLIASLAALGLGSFGFAAEFAIFGYAVWCRRAT